MLCRCTLCRRTLHNLPLDRCDQVPFRRYPCGVATAQRPVGDGVVRLRRGKCVRRRCVKEQQVVLHRAEANARQIWPSTILVTSRNSPRAFRSAERRRMLERRQGTARGRKRRAQPYSTNRTPLTGEKSEPVPVYFRKRRRSPHAVDSSITTQQICAPGTELGACAPVNQTLTLSCRTTTARIQRGRRQSASKDSPRFTCRAAYWQSHSSFIKRLTSHAAFR